MEVKTDTKEKFHVITVISDHLSANLTDDLTRLFDSMLLKDPKNIVLNLANIGSIDEASGESLVKA